MFKGDIPWRILSFILVSVLATDISSAQNRIAGSTLSNYQRGDKVQKDLKKTITVATIFQELYSDPQIKEGHCPMNILYLVKHIQKNAPKLINDAEVLVLFRFDPNQFDSYISRGKTSLSGAQNYTTNLVATHLKEVGSQAYYFHMALRYKGRIYDLSLEGEKDGVPEESYYKKMFLAQGNIKYVPKKRISRPKLARQINKMERYRFKDHDEMLKELRIRAIPAAEYVNGYYDKIIKMNGSYSQMWLNAEGDYRSLSLGEYLDKAKVRRLPDYEEWPHASIVSPSSIYYPRGISAYANPGDLLLGETQQVANAVMVTGPFKYGEKFNRTDRDTATVRKLYPRAMLAKKELKGKVILDMACGGGLFVEELRLAGINAFGLDIALSPRQRGMMLHDTSLSNQEHSRKIILPVGRGEKIFIQAHAGATGIADRQVDIIYDTYGIFEYLFHARGIDVGVRAYLRSVVNEWRRILKNGGKIRIANIDKVYADEFRKYFEKLEGLRFVCFEIANKKYDPYTGVVELQRIDDYSRGAKFYFLPDVKKWL